MPLSEDVESSPAISEVSWEEVKAWLQKAHSDLRAAQILATHGPVVLDAAVFHCQ
jgi:HEPN domain-containing protein